MLDSVQQLHNYFQMYLKLREPGVYEVWYAYKGLQLISDISER